jgi:hypothetical protein
LVTDVLLLLVRLMIAVAIALCSDAMNIYRQARGQVRRSLLGDRVRYMVVEQ